MSLNRPLEGLLRPPVEWYSSAVGLTAAGLLSLHANVFLLPKIMADYATLGLCAFSLWRFKQGYLIWRYQRNLKRMPRYFMSSSQLPVSSKHLFLGRGFLWKTIHTQRLRDLDIAENQHYCHTSSLHDKARQAEFHWEKKRLRKHLAALFGKNTWFNPVRPYPDIGGKPHIHGVGEKEQDVTLSMTERAGHTIVIGTTRVGKTRLAEILISQDIRRGDVVIVLDPKGDADLLKRICIEAKIAGREHDVLIMHLGFPKSSCRYNPIGSFTKITQIATRITNALPSSGDAAAFKEFAWKYVNFVARCLVALGIRPTYKLIHFYITKLDQLLVRYCDDHVRLEDPNYESWLTEFIDSNTKLDKKSGETVKPTRQQAIIAYAQHYLEQRNQQDFNSLHNDLLTDLLAACRLDKTYYDKITASVGPLFEKLTTGEVGDLLSPNYSDYTDERPILDWLQVIRNKQIVYIGMDAMTDNVVSSAIGNAMLSDLVSVAGHLYNFGLDHGYQGLVQQKTPLPNICLHSDEFNEVIGNEFIPLLNKAGGAGFKVTAYTQTWSDVEARLGSAAKAGQVAGNLNAMIMLRVKEAKTADMLINQLPKVPILRVVPASSSSDSPHGEEGIYYKSTNEDRFSQTDVSLITQNEILNLPKGQAFCLLEGGKLYKIRIPLPKDDNIALPSNVVQLVTKMRERDQGIEQKVLHTATG